MAMQMSRGNLGSWCLCGVLATKASIRERRMEEDSTWIVGVHLGKMSFGGAAGGGNGGSSAGVDAEGTADGAAEGGSAVVSMSASRRRRFNQPHGCD